MTTLIQFNYVIYQQFLLKILIIILDQMTRVTFTIEFCLKQKIEFIGKAIISHFQASKIDGLLAKNEQKIINFKELKMEQQEPKKRGRKKKNEIETFEIAKSQKQQNDQEDEEEINQTDLNELQKIEMQIEENNQQNMLEDMNQENQMEMEIQNDSNDFGDSNSEQNQQIMLNFERKKMTKRQMGELQNPLQLPDKKPRKKRNMYSQQQQLKKQEKQQKRRQYMRKQVQNQKMQTLDKILNETGRKQRQRNQKQIKQKAEKQNKIFRQLGDVPKIIYHCDQTNTYLINCSSKLFPDESLKVPVIPKKPNCYLCKSKGKYKIKQKMVCSLSCYKIAESSV